MGCRCKERKEFLQKRWQEYRAAAKAGAPPKISSFLQETAMKLPIGHRNLPPQPVTVPPPDDFRRETRIHSTPPPSTLKTAEQLGMPK